MKRYLLGIFAIVLAIGFSAFKSSNADVIWYLVDGSGVVQNPNDGVKADETLPPAECDDGFTLCARAFSEAHATLDQGTGRYIIEAESGSFDHQTDYVGEAFKE